MESTVKTAKPRLWKRDFTLLWQGQMVSDFGNAITSVALGFWAYATTGNEAAMGMVMACFSIPQIVLGPLAGALADRLNRKWLLIGADGLRGVIYLLMGLLMFLKLFPFWLIYPLALLAGGFGAFFSPAMGSALPDIVDREALTQANSARSLSTALMEVVGPSAGGMLYTALTAPGVFLINGASYLYAVVAQFFVRIPRRAKPEQQQRHILADMGEGFRYIWNFHGVRMLIGVGAFLNFFAMIGMTLFIPWFEQTDWLGAKRYGFMMGAFTAGSIAGMVLLSVVKLPAKRRALVFCGAIAVMGAAMLTLPFLRVYGLMVAFAALAGLNNALVNVLLQTVMQINVAPENRGKVFGILNTLIGGLMPVAMMLSGVLGRMIGAQLTIKLAFIAMVVCIPPVVINRGIHRFINTEQGAWEEAAEPVAAELLTAEAEADA